MFYPDKMTLRDSYGRQRIFKGINICIKKDRFTYFVYRKARKLDKLFDQYAAQGINMIRLGFNWAALEPRRGQYDQRAFALLKQYVQAAQDRDMYVLLDVHQDLFCSKFRYGDGAPRWVTKAYARKRPIAVWAEGYFYFQDVQRAFNDFWRNKNQVQQDFSRLWDKIIEEFQDYDHVIGYDFLNEPMITDHSNTVFCRLIDQTLAAAVGESFCAQAYFQNGKEKRGFLQLCGAVLKRIQKTGGLHSFLHAIDSASVFGAAVKGLEAYTQAFNRESYQPFMDAMAAKTDGTEKLAFFEHNYYSNLGIPFDLDTQARWVYSPHAYDLFIDSPLYNRFSSNARIRYILDAIRQNQLRMQTPVVMGEWGGSARHGHQWIAHIDYVYSVFEQNQWSCIYWNYKIKDKKFTAVMNRPYPCAVCGEITAYRSDSKTRHFRLDYTCLENTAPTVVYVPGKGYLEYDNQVGNNVIELDY